VVAQRRVRRGPWPAQQHQLPPLVVADVLDELRPAGRQRVRPSLS
jgi:hypothetical protein